MQDTWANAVENGARLLGPDLKLGGGAQELRDFYVALGELCANADQGMPIDPGLLDRVKALQVGADTIRRRDR